MREKAKVLSFQAYKLKKDIEAFEKWQESTKDDNISLKLLNRLMKGYMQKMWYNIKRTKL